MVPLPAATFRIRWLCVSAIKMLPEPSTATPLSWCSLAEVAAPPSPESPLLVPATVVMSPVEALTLRTR